jgi:hypothetical protein
MSDSFRVPPCEHLRQLFAIVPDMQSRAGDRHEQEHETQGNVHTRAQRCEDFFLAHL